MWQAIALSLCSFFRHNVWHRLTPLCCCVGCDDKPKARVSSMGLPRRRHSHHQPGCQLVLRLDVH